MGFNSGFIGLIYYYLNILSMSHSIPIHRVDTSLLPAYSRIQTGGVILFLLQYIGLSHGEILSVDAVLRFCPGFDHFLYVLKNENY